MSYLPESIESVQGEDMLDKEFGLAANAFLVIDDMNAKDIVKIKNEIVQIDGVSNVTWVDDIADISIPQSMLPDALTDIFYANGGKSTLLMIQFEQGSATTSTMNAIKEIRTKDCSLVHYGFLGAPAGASDRAWLCGYLQSRH